VPTVTRSIKVQDFLRNQPLFQDLGTEEIDRLAHGTRILHVPKGDVLFQKGDPVLGFHVVVYGQVKLAFPSAQGAEKVVEIVGPGFSFGEALMFLERPYVVYAQALADAMLLHVSKEVVFAEVDRDRQFAVRMLAGMSRRLHGLVADVESYSLRSGVQRVIGFLLRCDAASPDDDCAYTVTLPATKVTIASRLNLTPEHFSRILHDLSAAGLISVAGREVRIVDPAKLRNHMD
jgi:CRP-like cAMP-binding protein